MAGPSGVTAAAGQNVQLQQRTFWRLSAKFITKIYIYIYLFLYFSITKPTRCTNFTNLFWHETLHVSGSSFVHQQDQDGTAVPSRSCSTAVYKPVWHKPLLSVQWINCWWWTDELSETCRVHAKNKFVKLVHLVGFVVKATCVLFTGQPVTVWGQVQSQTKPF